MDYSPPPLFKQGTSAVARLVLYVAIALALLIVDARFNALSIVRQIAATVLMPVERVVLVPRDALRTVFDYAQSSATLAGENRELRRSAVEQAEASVRQAQLEAENNQLRKLLGLQQQSATPVTTAEILYDARDPYSQRIVIDKGSQHGLRAGYPVIDERGVVGQVTRVSPFQSEVTLLTDKDQAIPVQVVRNGLRSVAFGGARAGQLDLRFMAAAADLQEGDLLVTSGLDGTYPPGLPVAKIAHIERKADTAFSRVWCEPVAGVRSHRQLLVVRYDSAMPPRETIEAKTEAPAKGARSAAARAAAASAAAAKAASAPAAKEAQQ
ncbi:rod shape-determining protein MreC [Cupriavidus pinatubonensis]|uniref:rod shape-determining protein MreC n=1 Tax=Cupriavidus pinatubonensis TaxID=248026 RepID=UPI00112837E9|nr:rod shape-determining protein MreC [Cupriavidus pinatubonensis]QYY31712.1 rod shape-determining protein MreC [Cupriavidus pinatubonensis]TPQ34696.1 rod shape-determining protein MreC [Cupriavidus pinatubonensis]